MKSQYQDKDEDKEAIELINQLDSSDLNELEGIFKQSLLPLREKYFFYFVGKYHSTNSEEMSKWGTDKCKFKLSGLKTFWWEEYLQYSRAVKLKIRAENNPELPKIEFSDEISEEQNLHQLFIKKGYFYKDQMDRWFDNMVLLDINDPNADWNGSKTMSYLQIIKELKKFDKEYDSYKLVQVKDVRNYSDLEWCPACHESPCMCSDPF